MLQPDSKIFDEAGSIHVHVDGGAAKNLRVLPQEIFKNKYKHKYSDIVRATPGPQRAEQRDIYRLHTPASAENESLEYFSTTLLHEGPSRLTAAQRLDLVRDVRTLLSQIFFKEKSEKLEAVVEVERIVGCIEGPDPAKCPWIEDETLDGIFANELFPFDSNRDASYEVHLGIDIAKQSPDPPIVIRDLLKLADSAGMRVGGWFLFKHAEKWAYRSNMFTSEVSREGAIEWRDLIERNWKNDPTTSRIPAKFKVLVEESLGVWNTNHLKHRFNDAFITIPELIYWEKTIAKPESRPGEFWVVTGNFLGDQYSDIADAMESNINNGVRYLYVLSSYADVRRWIAFFEHLKRELRGKAQIDGETIRAFLLDVDPAFQNAFIAVYSDDEATGYRIRALNGDIVGADVMDKSQVQRIVRFIRRLVAEDDGRSVQRLTRVDEADEFNGAIAYISFGAPIDMKPGKLRGRALMLGRLDADVGRLASQNGSSNVFSDDSGILVVFRPGSDAGPRDAVRNAYKFAIALVAEVAVQTTDESDYRDFRKDARLLVDYGLLERTFRSEGPLITGDPVNRCRYAANVIAVGERLITEDANRLLETSLAATNVLPLDDEDLPKLYRIPQQ